MIGMAATGPDGLIRGLKDLVFCSSFVLSDQEPRHFKRGSLFTLDNCRSNKWAL